MAVPLWFLVKRKELGYRDFYNRYKSSDDQAGPLFALLAVSEADPYVNSFHILRRLDVTYDTVTSRSMAYYFLYWIFNDNFKEENTHSGIHGQPLNIFKYVLPITFASSVQDLTEILLLYFFGSNTFQVPEPNLVDTLAFADKLRKAGFEYGFYQVKEYSRLTRSWKILLDLKEWFREAKFPSWVDSIQFPALSNNPPLKCLLQNPNSGKYVDEMISYLEKIESSEYLEYMVPILVKAFPEKESKLGEIIRVKPEFDVKRIRNFFLSLNPGERMYYLPVSFPILDYQVEKFIQSVEKDGFEAVLKSYFDNYRERLLQEYSEANISNEITLVSWTSIYQYPSQELIWLTYGSSIHVFAREDLKEQFINPYNREILPSWVIEEVKQTPMSISYLDLWSRIVKRSLRS